MKTIEEIKNEISKDLGHENFEELFYNAVKNLPIEKAFLKINSVVDEISHKIQQEQQKLIAENADTKMERYNDLQDVLVVDKSSIINENNIIRWKYSN